MEPLNKIIDKSEKERNALTRKIIELEEKEDDFKLLQKRHEDRVVYLAEQFEQLSFDVDSILSSSDMSSSYRIKGLESNQELRHQMAEYVQNHFDDIEKLITERNQLPWE